MMEELQGTVAAIVFQSADGVFCVLRLKRKDNGQSVTAAGQIGVPAVGRSVTLRGCWVQHPRFGMQFKAVSMTEQMPERSEDIEQYLASGEIEGIGPAMARRIVDAFGSRTLEILDRNPEALLSVPGIGERKLKRSGPPMQRALRSAARCSCFRMPVCLPDLLPCCRKPMGKGLGVCWKRNRTGWCGKFPG